MRLNPDSGFSRRDLYEDEQEAFRGFLEKAPSGGATPMPA